MRPEGSLITSYNEEHQYVVRVRLSHDEDFYSIINAARHDYPNKSYLSKIKDDDMYVFAEKEKNGSWYLRLEAINETYTQVVRLYNKQFMTLNDSEKLEKAVIEKYAKKYADAFSIQNQRNTMLEIMMDVSKSTPDDCTESVDFNNYNIFSCVTITYCAADDTFDVTADYKKQSIAETGLDFDELEMVLKDMGNEHLIENTKDAI